VSVNAAARPARPVPAAAWWIGVAIVLVAANLRPAVVGVAPMLSQIQAEERLSATAAGILTALPVLCFGLIAPLAPPLARRIGIERALLTALGLLIIGFLVRSSGPLAALYAGTVLLGSAIAIGNVLLPSLIKRDFAHRTGMMTGLYTMAIAGGGALAAGVTMPVAQAAGLGWPGALAIWALFALVALLCWLPQVTIYMGLQSLGYFAVTAWLPAMLVERGYDPVVAGWLLSLSTVAGIAGATMAPVLATRGRRQRGLAFGITAMAAVGLVGVVAPLGVEPVAVLLLGAAQSAALGLALTLVAVRAPDAMHAAQLSGMSQSVGYVLAAAGPFAVGALRDATGGWTVPLLLLIALLAVQGTAGMLAGRDKQVRRHPV
jgi:CP family cyanate transporter-like MFS transporter